MPDLARCGMTADTHRMATARYGAGTGSIDIPLLQDVTPEQWVNVKMNWKTSKLFRCNASHSTS